MAELIRDTAFGHLVRLVARKRYFKFAEEEDPSIWTRFIDEKKSGYLAHHGDASPPEDDDESLEGLGGVRTRENQYTLSPPANMRSLQKQGSYNSRAGAAARINKASGIKIDDEKGKDIHLVSWYGDSDPENVSILAPLWWARN